MNDEQLDLLVCKIHNAKVAMEAIGASEWQEAVRLAARRTHLAKWYMGGWRLPRTVSLMLGRVLRGLGVKHES
jgi:hypothetical protein